MAIIGALFDIRRYTAKIADLVEDDDGEEEDEWMTPEEQAEYDERTRFLQERIAYHRAKLEEERTERERRARRSAWLRRLVRVA